MDRESVNRKFEKELKSGTAALVLLGIISAAGRPMYGYQITREIAAAGGGKHGGSGSDVGRSSPEYDNPDGDGRYENGQGAAESTGRTSPHGTARGGGRVLFRQGALYPVLRSMERSGILASEIEPSVSGPPRRYYSITAEGAAILEDWKATWRETRDIVDRVLAAGDRVSAAGDRVPAAADRVPAAGEDRNSRPATAESTGNHETKGNEDV